MSTDNEKSEARPGPRGGGAAKGAKGAADEKPKTGLNRLPGYLREDLGLPDWLASSAVIVAGGVLMCLLLVILIQIFPG
ncbi:MAG: hypothetical protein ABI333_05070 [bacterium]